MFEFGSISFIVSENQKPDEFNVISLNQINCKHLESRRRQKYKQAPCRLVLLKIISENPEVQFIGEVRYLDGCTSQQVGCSNFDCPFLSLKVDSLTKGKYIVLYKFDWIATQHPERKVVFSIYGPGMANARLANIKKSHKQLNRKMMASAFDFIKKRLKIKEDYVMPLRSTLGSQSEADIVANYSPTFTLEDFDFIELYQNSQNLTETIYYHYILTDECDRNIKNQS